MSIIKLGSLATRPGAKSKVMDLNALKGDWAKAGALFGTFTQLQQQGFRFYVVAVKHPKK